METTQETNTDGKTTTNDAEAAHARTRRPERALARALERLEKRFEHAGDMLWSALKKRPALSVGMVTVAGSGLAALIGASELVVGIGAGVAAYQVLKKHEPPSKALEDAARFGL